MRAIWPGALLVVYLSATLLVLVAGRARVSGGGIAMHATLLAAVAIGTFAGVTPRWLRAWIPLFALLPLYSEIPMLLRAAGHVRLFDDLVIGWERAIFHGQPAVAWARALPNELLSETLNLAYLSYYPIIFVTPLLLYRAARHDEFAEDVFVLMCTFVVCFAAYLLFPVAGPRYEWPAANGAHGRVRAFTRWLLETRSSRGTAFPSSHVAVSLTQAVLTLRYFGARGGVVVVLCGALAAGAVYGGYHYAVDVLAGAATGVACTVAGLAAFGAAGARASGERDRAEVVGAGVIDAA